MHVSIEALQLHIDYTVWASQRILDAAAALSHHELTRDFGTGDKSVLGTLLHVWGGDYVWIERMHGRSLTSRPYDAHASLATLQTEWPRVWQQWSTYVGGLTAEKAEADVAYLTFKGEAYRTPAWQIVLHIVNHGAHHRGQAAGFIRSMGKTPPVLDLIHYYRQTS
jgi:uncharacterized damage-inducible protein DinB